MKRRLALVCLVGLAAAGALAQTSQPAPYKVVFDLTSPDPLDQQAVVRWVKEISSGNPTNQMEVVMYGRGLELVVAGKTTQASAVQDAIAAGRATFTVCAIALKNQKIEPSQLLAGVQVVPDGIGEIVARQTAGWGYIKVGH